MCRVLSGRRLLDGLLLLLLSAVVFLLGCYEMGDSDIWWHLRGGQWILEHGRVPHLDPFTFGSADKVWVDIHWLYEVILALCYRAGGVGALVLLGAAAGTSAFLAVLTARRQDWPVASVVLCWISTLVLLSFRLDPRPEIFSLLCLGCYLAVLWRVEERPTLVWLLPVFQVLWANVQGLFILGPILLGMFIAAHGARLAWRRLRGTLTLGPAEKRWWRHVLGASLAVAAACLVNPYFIDGARFPFDLYPKVSDPNNLYKKYIDELMSPRDAVREFTRSAIGVNWFFLTLYFLLALLPLSFLYPAVWRAWRAPRPITPARKILTSPDRQRRGAPALAIRAGEDLTGTGAWLGGLIVLVGLLVLSSLTLSGKGPSWLDALGDNVPLAILLSGGIAAYLLNKRCPPAAAVAGVGAVALAAWIAWLNATLLGDGRGIFAENTSPAQLTIPLAITGLIATALVLRWGGDLFRILLAGAFAYLALQALQNWSRFALVTGAVLTWNFGEWAAEWTLTGPPSKGRNAAGWGLRIALALVLGVWIAALAGDRFYIHTGQPRHLAFREEPLAFAHDAAIFAGQSGLPDRAVVYGLDQTGVYVFHNAPRYKPFMDGRLEMPDLQTFKTYTNLESWLAQKDPRWEETIAEMDYPLLLLAHQQNFNAEALLLTHSDWRCVYFDALASVFIPRNRGISTDTYPTIDFAARHFREPTAAPVPDVKGAAAREEKALFNLAASLPRSPEVTWRWRIPVLLTALDRAQLALDEDPARPDVWVALGNCYRTLNPDTGINAPAEGWNLERGIYLAQATYCLRRALECQVNNAPAWRSLFEAYQVRGMADSQLAAGEQWLRLDPKISPEQREQILRLRKMVGTLPPHSCPEAAVERIEAAEQRQLLRWTWEPAEQTANLYMHLGRPADARRVWLQATDCPSPALRLARLASTYWVERDFDTALRHYREASKADPNMPEVPWALAMIHTQLSDATLALDACRRGLRLSSLNTRQRSDLEALQRFLLPHASRQGERPESVGWQANSQRRLVVHCSSFVVSDECSASGWVARPERSEGRDQGLFHALRFAQGVPPDAA